MSHKQNDIYEEDMAEYEYWHNGPGREIAVAEMAGMTYSETRPDGTMEWIGTDKQWQMFRNLTKQYA